MLKDYIFELGTTSQNNPKKNQVIRLINKICIFVMAVITPYMILTFYFGAMGATLIQFLAILHLGFTIYINSKQQFNLARAMTLLIGNFHIFVMTIILGNESGVYFYFSAAIIAPLFFYFRNELKYIIGFVSLTTILAMIVHYFGKDYPPGVTVPEALITGFFYFSVFGSLLTIFAFVFHFYNESNRNEKSLEDANLKLHKLSETDPLTQLPNRRCFYRNLEREWAKGIRNLSHCAVIMMDIDNFKAFNDLNGHQKGDECLVNIAKIISKNTRELIDNPARYGGEEFIILLSETDLDTASKIAERMRKEILDLRIPAQNKNPDKIITCSFGVSSTIPGKALKPDDLIFEADKALYKAKKLGKNRVEKMYLNHLKII